MSSELNDGINIFKMEINVSDSQMCDILQLILMVVKKTYPAFELEKYP